MKTALLFVHVRQALSYAKLDKRKQIKTPAYVALFPGSCVGEEEREPGIHCSRMRQVPLVTCILLRYTKITVNFCLPPEGRTAWLYSLLDTYGRY